MIKIHAILEKDYYALFSPKMIDEWYLDNDIDIEKRDEISRSKYIMIDDEIFHSLIRKINILCYTIKY